MNKEIAHYVVTAHPPGGVLLTAKCNFLSPYSQDVLVAKSRRLEVRQLRSAEDATTATGQPSPFQTVLQMPVNGRIVSLLPLKIAGCAQSLVFVATDNFQYAVVQHCPDKSPYPVMTHAAGKLKSESVLGREAETATLSAVDPYSRCMAVHLYDGLISILPVNGDYTPRQAVIKGCGPGGGRSRGSSRLHSSVLGEPFHCRIEERTVLALTFLQTDPDSLPQLVLLHQDARGAQHITSHVINLQKKQLHLCGSPTAPSETVWLKKTAVDGGSSLLIAVPAGQVSPVAAAAGAAQQQQQQVSKKSACPGVVVIGQRQLTYCSPTATKIVPCQQALVLTYEELPADGNGMPRYLLGDEFGNLHMLTVQTSAQNNQVVSLQFDTLGSCTLSTALAYLGQGLVFVGSNMGDSQLVQIHDEPIQLLDDDEGEDVSLMDTTYLTVIEEYTHLGPILDFDLVPTTPDAVQQQHSSNMIQSQVVMASGSSKTGSIRLVRNGIGMNEYGSVEIPGIQNMWSLRRSAADQNDAYLVQSFVGETRVLGVTSLSDQAMHDAESEEQQVGGTLEEVFLPGLESTASSLYVGNIEKGDRLLQITESDIRLVAMTTGQLLDSWQGEITVATANEAGQIAVALRGGMVVYFCIQDDNDKIDKLHEKQMDREVSCIDLHPFAAAAADSSSAMEIDGDDPRRLAANNNKSALMAVGLWDDFTVRLLSLEAGLDEQLCINLGTDLEEETEDLVVVTGAGAAGPSRQNRNNMMARSLCLITLDFSSSSSSGTSSSSSSSPGVNMLFVGLGDGTLISFAVVTKHGVVSVQAKKEVCLGTQRIDLVPLNSDRGGTCVLATGDRPTVIYLAGVGGASANLFNPKLCYSTVNLAASEEEEGDDVSRPPSQQSIAVNVAAPFFSPLLFDAASMGNQHYCLCVADDSNLRLGVIDDIQKLHVTTCRLGMAPKRIVHCPEGRLFAVGCVESGIRHFGLGGDEANMGNCIRFMDDTTFDDIERVDLEPYETILSMVYASLKVPSSNEAAEAAVTAEGESSNAPVYKPFLLVGTAYALPDEEEPTRGRILVYSCQSHEGAASNVSRAVRQVTELSTTGAVHSICQFYHGKVLCTVNSKTQICHLVDDANLLRLQFLGVGHHGHILSLFVKSQAKRTLAETTSKAISSEQTMSMDVSDQGSSNDKKQAASDNEPKEMFAIVGDLMRSISLVQYYPEHETLEEVARDYNGNWMTAIEMLNDNVYLGCENWNNLFCLRRNTVATSEEVRCRLDNVGEFHLGEMVNKFMGGSLVMPVSSSSSSNKSSASANRRRRALSSPQKKKAAADSPSKGGGSASRIRRPVVVTGSQTLFGTVEGTLGVVLGLDARTAAFFGTLERAMAVVIRPVGDFRHQLFRAFQAEKRTHPAHGFVDGDLVESFLDLDRTTMEAVVKEMNRDGGWEIDDAVAVDKESGAGDDADGDAQDRPELSVDDVVAMVEEMTMLH